MRDLNFAYELSGPSAWNLSWDLQQEAKQLGLFLLPPDRMLVQEH